MVTKKQFKKSLNKKNKKVNSTKKNKTYYRKKTRLNKLKNVYNGGAITTQQISKEIPNILEELKKYNLSTIIEDEKENIKDKPQPVTKPVGILNIFKPKRKTNKNNTFSINYKDKYSLFSLIKTYIENLYKGKEDNFYYKFIVTNWKTEFEQILPKTNNDKDNMFLIFDYFRNQMNLYNTITPKYMAPIFLSSFIEIEFIGKNKDEIMFGLTSFFNYIKENDFYKNYISNRLTVLRNNMSKIISSVNDKTLETGVFREAGEQTHLDTFYLENKIDDKINIYTLCTLIKHYIKYLFIIYDTIDLKPNPEFTPDNVEEFVKTFLSKLSKEDSKNMISIFMYLKQVMTNDGITKMNPTNISVVITPNFFPKLQLNTTNNVYKSIEINKNYTPLFNYIKTYGANYDENGIGSIINITKSRASTALPITPKKISV
jgi:hypothetical protein